MRPGTRQIFLALFLEGSHAACEGLGQDTRVANELPAVTAGQCSPLEGPGPPGASSHWGLSWARYPVPSGHGSCPCPIVLSRCTPAHLFCLSGPLPIISGVGPVDVPSWELLPRQPFP